MSFVTMGLGAGAAAPRLVTLGFYSSDDELFPLAGLTQTYPLTAQQTFPLAGQNQDYPLGGSS